MIVIGYDCSRYCEDCHERTVQKIWEMEDGRHFYTCETCEKHPHPSMLTARE